MQTGAPCLFRVGPDGIERCFSPSLLLEEENGSSVLNYLDSSCTRPAWRRAQGDVNDYITVVPESDCNLRTYQFGAPLPSRTPLYEKRAGSSCQRLPENTDPGVSIAPLEEVPPETFVAMKRVSRPRHPDMNALVREGEDGSSEIIGFFDPVREVPCFGPGANLSPQVCVPSLLQTWGDFGDAACTQRVGFDEAPRCVVRASAALVELKAQDESCRTKRTIAGLWQTGEVRQTPVFTKSNGTCEGRQTELASAYLQGDPIDVASLPKLELLEVGDGPLRSLFYGFGGVPFYPAPLDHSLGVGVLFEGASGERCRPTLFADMTWRCVPSSFAENTNFDVYYESDDCTGPRVFPAPTPTTCADTPGLRGIVVIDLQKWSATEGSYPVVDTLEFGEQLGALSVFRKTGSGTCQIVDQTAASPALVRMKKLNAAELFAPMERKRD